MKYMVLIYGNHEAWSAIGKDTFDKIMGRHQELQEELTASGELIDTNELPPGDAKVVRTHSGVPAVTDGPFAEAKEVLAGYYLLDCANIDRAAEIAARLLEAEFAPVEVRQIPPG